MKDQLEDFVGAMFVFVVPFAIGMLAYGFGG
jgi:hypothetical protein